jgi:glucose-1-phosphate adenylyltransferase
LPAIGIGKGSRITGAIIDRDVRIGAGVEIVPFPPGTNLDNGNWSVRDGVVVIPHHAVIPERTFIAPS